MATSTLTFYQTDITPERNAAVDDVEYYLNHYCNRLVYNNFQYQTLDIDKSIKVTYEQSNYLKFPYNYVAIRNSDNLKTFYYFIVGSPKWLAQNTVQLQLSMDTVTTFRDDLVWTERTKITRMHFDRFIQQTVSKTATTKLKRIVDDFEEGITPAKYLTSQTKLNEAAALNTDWYLIYKNKSNITANETVPIECFCCGGMSIPVNSPTTSVGINIDAMANGSSAYIVANDLATNLTFTVNNVSYTIGKTLQYKALVVVKAGGSAKVYRIADGSYNLIVSGLIGVTALNPNAVATVHQVNYQFAESELTVGYLRFLGLATSLQSSTYLISNSTINLSTIDSVNRSDTSIVKIIKLPYAPFELTLTNSKLEIPTGWTYANGYFYLQNLNTEFLRTLTKQSTATQLIYSMTAAEANDILNIHNDSSYESKLYNSNFYTLKYVYDNFEKEILLERCTPTSTSTYVGIKFKPSNNLSGNSLFDFTGSGMSVREPQIYGQYMMCNRENEVALYNSDYLNYMRTGYNYDKKAKRAQIAADVAGIVIGAGGTGFSIANKTGVGYASAISLGTSVVNNITSTIFTAIKNEQAIKQKMDETKKSAASVSNTTDLNLLTYYNGNRLIKVIEEVNPIVKGPIYNLFRLTGYACEEYMEPVTDTRIWYNFIQCEPEFDEKQWLYSEDILNDIKYRYQLGVTYFHKNNNLYDFSQEKENFERWFLD